MASAASSPQIYLVTPSFDDRDAFAPVFQAVLDAAQVSAVLIAPRGAGDATDTYLRDCKMLVPIAQAAGAAALTLNDTQISGRSNADGIHLTGNLRDLKDTISRFRPQRIVGAGTIRTRHDAMTKGEAQPDYILFGDPFGKNGETQHQGLELAQWWSELFEVPCVAMAAADESSVKEAIRSKADFIGLNDFVWSHANGPEAAIKSAHMLCASS